MYVYMCACMTFKHRQNLCCASYASFVSPIQVQMLLPTRILTFISNSLSLAAPHLKLQLLTSRTVMHNSHLTALHPQLQKQLLLPFGVAAVTAVAGNLLNFAAHPLSAPTPLPCHFQRFNSFTSYLHLPPLVICSFCFFLVSFPFTSLGQLLVLAEAITLFVLVVCFVHCTTTAVHLCISNYY